jgi:hypothetical protein
MKEFSWLFSYSVGHLVGKYLRRWSNQYPATHHPSLISVFHQYHVTVYTCVPQPPGRERPEETTICYKI